MAKNYKLGAIALLGAALISIGAGCGGSDASEAETPTNAATVTNGDTTGGGTETGGGGGEGGDDAAVAAGKTFFETTCQGCHPAGGTEQGVGPQLSATTLDAEGIKGVVTNGRGAMPAGLASGEDLDNVAAYVDSLN